MRFGEVNCVFMGSYYIHRVIAGKPNRLASAGRDGAVRSNSNKGT